MMEYKVCTTAEERLRWTGEKTCDSRECNNRLGDRPSLVSLTQLGPKTLCDICAVKEIGSLMSELSTMLEQVRPKKR